jgi:hypothetical protein
LTTEASSDLSGIHARMPLILSPCDFRAWLDPETAGPGVAALLKPAPPGRLKRVEVGRYVNDPRHDAPQCVEPIPAGGGEDAGAERMRPAQGQLFEMDGDVGVSGAQRGR